MAVTTMELRNVMKHDGFQLFDFDYKIDDLQWKEDLEDVIINRFYFEEIGVESIDRFKFLFKAKMQRVMPYYNELYNTTLFDGDPLTTQRLEETLENLQDTTSKTDIDREDSNKISDYPQQQDPVNDIITEHQVSEGQTNHNRVDNIKQDQKRIIEGYHRMPYPELLSMHRNTIIRINERIINELKPLFIMVY